MESDAKKQIAAACCANCSRQLAEGTIECPHCFVEDIKHNDDERAILDLYGLVRRARAWMMLGIAIIPAVVAFPLAFNYAMKARRHYEQMHLDDPWLNNRIGVFFWFSAVFTVVSWMWAVYVIVFGGLLRAGLAIFQRGPDII